MFEYDVQAPFDIEDLSPPQDKSGVTVRDIAYASPRGGKVTAYLVVPAGNGPFAGVLFLHPGQGDRSTFLDEAIAFAQRGAVALSVDGTGTRPPQFRLPRPRMADEHLERWTQAIVDLQRGLDLLASRPDVDPRRLGYVGHSYGATLGGVLAGVETRVKAYVLMAGLVAHSEWWRSGDHEFYRRFREQVTQERLDEMVETMSTSTRSTMSVVRRRQRCSFSSHTTTSSSRNVRRCATGRRQANPKRCAGTTRTTFSTSRLARTG